MRQVSKNLAKKISNSKQGSTEKKKGHDLLSFRQQVREYLPSTFLQSSLPLLHTHDTDPYTGQRSTSTEDYSSACIQTCEQSSMVISTMDLFLASLKTAAHIQTYRNSYRRAGRARASFLEV